MTSEDRSAVILPMRGARNNISLPTSLWQRVAILAYSKAKAHGLHPDCNGDDRIEAEFEIAAGITGEKLAA